MSDDTLQRVSRIVTDIAGSPVSPTTKDVPLLSTGLNLDSTAVLELILAVEREFDIEFDDNELSVDLFRTLGALAGTVDSKLGAPAPAAPGTTPPVSAGE